MEGTRKRMLPRRLPKQSSNTSMSCPSWLKTMLCNSLNPISSNNNNNKSPTRPLSRPTKMPLPTQTWFAPPAMFKSPMTNLPVYQVQPTVGVNPDSYLQPYTYAPPTVVSTHASPTFLQAQAVQVCERATEGSPLAAYETVPKVRGSPQATIVSTNVSSESSQSARQNPQMNS